MSAGSWLQLLALIALILATAWPLGKYMARVYDGEASRLDKVVGPVERLIYRICRVDPDREQRWNVYAALFAILVVGILVGGSIWIMFSAHERMMPGIVTEIARLADDLVDSEVARANCSCDQNASAALCSALEIFLFTSNPDSCARADDGLPTSTSASSKTNKAANVALRFIENTSTRSNRACHATHIPFT